MTQFITKKSHGKIRHIPITSRPPKNYTFAPSPKRKRKITAKDRKEWHENAMKGEKIWENMSPRARKKRIERDAYTQWQFVGKSPNTRDIVHK
ncbi:MAG: hypothetical protein QW292_12635 [Candidatus Parvarchaeota archaeon]